MAFITAISVSSDGRYVAAVAFGGSVYILDLQTGKLERTFHVDFVESSGGFVPGGHFLAVSGESRSVWDPGHYSISLWNADTGTRVWKTTLPNSPTQGFAVSRDGHFVAVGCAGAKLVIVDAQSGQRRAYYDFHSDDIGIDRIDFSPDSSTLAVGTEDGQPGSSKGICWIFPVSLRLPQTSWDIGGTTVGGFSYSPDGTLLATSTAGSGAITLWDPKIGKQMGRFTVENDSVYDMEFSPDGKMLYGEDVGGVFARYDLDCKLHRK